MSNTFQEPDCIGRWDRSFGDRGEELRLERGEYQGKPTYSLRILWRTDDGSWRWSQAKPTSSGKTWQVFNLKARELAELGALLIAESKSPQRVLDTSQPIAGGRGQNAHRQPRRAEPDEDLIPF